MPPSTCRPHRQPHRTPAAIEAQVLRLRREHRIGPLRLAARTGISGQPPASRVPNLTGRYT
ncbi:hypothetical protein FHS32_001833 [Streptomyces albaduncus]|uniref:Transposase n=1 Tax=Streptomyces griseoloalbus TaxID=67303 RepID=A0A7W8F965_9ACTN|nr:hypothetical protein [Streptomyces albaduncus]GGW30152.1 hypothetical protein GCM10010340_04820 [Streptomyces albaduncus]